ncbi:hypothetical protein M409DRAFT_67838 [Zasmidium cellare ATCC 36951]|uniref:Epoxide hydrolase N-terminal domain-containing protein n=1 Tax=Zasmidium cellare ATCC 36951 TaxID=1080233 RepID=A0A6A6CFP9_ZASCE|nr:uncharacterized protein M409DRAFT_67838 [Zasmidium cellare ATCC 36951]KAF2164752.1 hypothetical protein M409DRAFT_67838 [Zasmidium cellare ATCC 36951]
MSVLVPIFLVGSLVLLSAARNLAEWSTLPRDASTAIKPIEVRIPDAKVFELQSAVRAQHGFIPTYENTRDDLSLGISWGWMQNATSFWTTDFSWRGQEEEFNRHPHFQAIVQTSNRTHSVHFVGLFSSKPDALPFLLLHGFPGSFLEFMELLDLVKQEYKPWDSPFHIIVPSLVGFTFTEGPSIHLDWTLADTASVLDKLMLDLGFGDGYVAQGGDIGSFIATHLARNSHSSVHVNTFSVSRPASVHAPENDTNLTALDREILDRSSRQMQHGFGYALEQGTAPATISFAVSKSAISLLAWLGEKYLAWVDPNKPLSFEKILTAVSLYHLTDTFPRSIYSYREIFGRSPPENPYDDGFIDKPFGYSRFRFDVSGVPPSWAAASANMVFSKSQEHGGHFAALERPRELWEDVQEFARRAFPHGFL